MGKEDSAVKATTKNTAETIEVCWTATSDSVDSLPLTQAIAPDKAAVARELLIYAGPIDPGIDCPA